MRLWPLPRAARKSTAIQSLGTALALGAVLIGSSLTLKAQLPIRINSGGGSYTDAESMPWAVDNSFTGGSVFATGASIDGTLDDALYQTERYGDFSYAIPLSNGACHVTLHFSEIYWNHEGQRLFDVRADGTTVLNNLDIWRETGQFSAMTQSFSVVVSDGELNLDFVSGIDHAKLSALEVHNAAGISIVSNTSSSPVTVPLAGTGFAPETNPLLVLSPTYIDFGSAYVGQTGNVHSIALANHGDTLLNVTSFSPWGAHQHEFLLPNDAPLAINPGQTVSVEVAFSPVYPGGKTANMLATVMTRSVREECLSAESA